MSLFAGAVSVSAAGVASGIGLAKEIFDDYLPKVAGIPVGPIGATAKQQIADLCNSIAQKTVSHIMTNAVVTTPPGVPVTVAVPAGTGATTAPGVGAIT
jgi:hypothetical protein